MKIKETVERWWREASAIAALVFVILQFEAVKSDAEEAKTIMQQQTEINAKLTALVTDSDAKLRVYFEIMGFDKDTARAWAAMHRKPVTDSAGTPILGVPWLETDSTLMVGVRLMFGDSGVVLLDTLWDVRQKK